MSSEAAIDPLKLPHTLDLTAAAELRDDLTARRGAPLEIDASAVRRCGALCLQVLVAAKRDWDGAGQAFRFAARSDEFDEAIRLMGARPLLGLEESGGVRT